MKPWLDILALGTVTGVVIYLLYCRGIAVTKSVAAVLFVFWTQKSEDRAALNSCTGWVRHMGRFRRSGTYTFTLDCQLSNGDVAVSLLDQEKRELLCLNRYVTTGSIELESRCYLHWEFKGATGKCTLYWKNTPIPYSF